MNIPHIFGAYAFPLLLILSALFLTLKELALFHLTQRKNLIDKNPRARMLRRGISSFLVVIIAIMIHYGLTRLPEPTRHIYQYQLFYWTAVFGLVFIIIIIAAWDFYVGLRNLEQSVDQTSGEYRTQIKESIRNSRKQKHRMEIKD
jgi:hypothetical protein